MTPCACLCVRLLDLLPPTAEVHHLPSFEHLDLMWADDAKDEVFPQLKAFLRRHATCDAQLFEKMAPADLVLRVAPKMFEYCTAK